jgi:predicted negative regulator of RcsB-dependent stress response
MKFRKNTIQLISKTMLAFVVLGIGAYIICVYNTVLTVSKAETVKSEFQKLQVSVSEKEHEYIQSVSSINVAYAEGLGYVRVAQDKLAYVDLSKDTSLAVR